MKKLMVAGALLLAFAACGDPDTEDRRGYTKAPLEDAGLLIAGEDATVMAAMNRPNRPRPVLVQAPGVEEGEEGEAAEQQVTLAPGVTQEQFDQGRDLFAGAGACQSCHGPGGAGTTLGPDLTDPEWIHVSEPAVDELANVIRDGVPQPREYPAPMPPMGGANLTPEQVQALAAYVASIGQG